MPAERTSFDEISHCQAQHHDDWSTLFLAKGWSKVVRGLSKACPFRNDYPHTLDLVHSRDLNVGWVNLNRFEDRGYCSRAVSVRFLVRKILLD
jgi:hypothetical protein